MTDQPIKRRQHVIVFKGQSACGKSTYINDIIKALKDNGYTATCEHASIYRNKDAVRDLLRKNKRDDDFLFLHIMAPCDMTIEFTSPCGPMALWYALRLSKACNALI